MRSRFARLAASTALVHRAINLAHGWAQSAFIISVIGIAPLVAAGLLGMTRVDGGPVGTAPPPTVRR